VKIWRGVKNIAGTNGFSQRLGVLSLLPSHANRERERGKSGEVREK
jgi:hypothetical protein